MKPLLTIPALLALALLAAPQPALAQDRRIESPRFPVFGESEEREAFFAAREAERRQALADIQARRRAEAAARAASETADPTDGAARDYDNYVGYPVRDYARAPRCQWVPVTGVDRRLRRDDGKPGFAYPRERVVICRTGPRRPAPVVVTPLPRPPSPHARPNLRGYGRPGFDLNFPRY